MKFVLVSNDIYSVLNFRFDFIQQIKKMGHTVYILAPNLDQEPEVSKKLLQSGFILEKISMDRAGTNPISDLQTIYSIYKTLKKIQADIVFSYTIKPVIYGSIAASLLGIKKIFVLICGLGNMFQDGKDAKFSIVSTIVNQLYTLALDRCTKVFFQNQDDYELLHSFGILRDPSKGVIVNGSGINLSRFNVDPLKLDSNGNVIPSFIMVARLLTYKGVLEYVEAAKILKTRYPFAEFHLVGDRDENPASITQQDFDSWKSSNFIQCWGRLQDVRPALGQANVFVLPSYYREGIPRSILEAMSMGKAIVTTDNVGCRETVEIGKNGYLVKPKDVESLVAALQQLIEQPNLIRDMGLCSRKLAEDKFDVVKVNHSMVSRIF